jgi:hypothetical protein
MNKAAGLLFLLIFLTGALPAQEDQRPPDTLKPNLKIPVYKKFTNLFKDKSFVIAPELARKPETGVFAGLFYLQVFRLTRNVDTSIRKSNTESFFDYSERKQILASVKNNLIFKNERIYLKGENFYNKFPDQFWGIGGNTPAKLEEPVSYEMAGVNQRLLVRINKRYFAGIIYQYVKVSNVRFSRGGDLDTGHVSGSGGSQTSGVGLDFLYDSRDNIINAYKGLFVEASCVTNQKGLGGDHFFNNYTLDVRDFINLGGRKVLALQGVVNYNVGDVPFRQMAEIGGDMIMRGYYFGRFRDKLMLAAQAEYRFPVWRSIGLTAFVAGAELQPLFEDVNWKDIHYTAGLCLRIMINKKERLNIGVDSGIGKETNGLYFNSGEAF